MEIFLSLTRDDEATSSTSQHVVAYNCLQHNNLELAYLHQERRRADCTIVRNRLACLQLTLIFAEGEWQRLREIECFRVLG